MRELFITDLTNQQTGLSEGVSAYLKEALNVCFHLKQHPNPVKLKVVGDFEETFLVYWAGEANPLALSNWKAVKERTEFGAIAIAVLLLTALTNLALGEQSEEETGIDYWLILQKSFGPIVVRLEISGIWPNEGSDSLNVRINRKKRQMSQSDNTLLPGYVIVVEFSTPKAKFVKK